ncbi:uncharacterized protein LOC131000313 [Salvia miltiorrhiza]|uniref:uncharacterized protein LOC131000313 n=1 Tax=Salvia miltiorrhiza TaxID=226208 RepID=UPI0025AC602E|nr:uncharacterized protein LOC131000313 [Salvia miltiorrhiza]
MLALVEYVRNLWPLSTLIFYNNHDDLRASDGIVKKLSIPESTKHFVYAIREPESQAVIYVLAVQNLSERSASDAECLIREIKPDAVVVQVGQLSESEMAGLRETRVGLIDENGGFSGDDTVPTSVFEVLMNCFMHKTNKDKYEDVAGSLVLREIFGVSFNGHLVAAKKAAEEVGSSFLMLESPFVKCNLGGDVEGESGGGDSGFPSVFGLQMTSLVSKNVGSPMLSLNSRAFRALDEVQSQMVKSLSSILLRASPPMKLAGEEVRPLADYEVPQFARCVYPLLVDLHDIFVDIPSMGNALACAQKMLCDVNKGETVDNSHLSEVYAFPIAVEGLRIALNNAGRVVRSPAPAKCEFSDLPMDDQTHAILAQTLRSQASKYKSIVAVVDASGLAGLRKNWKTALPLDVKHMVDQLVINLDDDGEDSAQGNRRWKLADKPVVAVGAGATAVLGASSLSKAVPVSTFVKVVTLNVPASLQIVLSQTQKAFVLAFGKALGPTKVMASSSLKGSTLKAVASAEKIRAVAHGVIASAEKTSLSAMRSAFYEIMRKRRAQRVGVMPWATFGCSIATCAGLLACGDGIECAAESIPSAPSIASLGRGIQNLHLASMVVRPAESSRIQRSIESLLHKFKNLKIKIQ